MSNKIIAFPGAAVAAPTSAPEVETEYIGLTDTAKLIRKALKAAFPETKFSVRSSRYAGGSSIDVEWIDGPTDDEVSGITAHFAGATFDGMQDLKEYVTQKMEDGRQVHYSCDFVFRRRRYSVAFLSKCAEAIAKEYNLYPPVAIVPSSYGAYTDPNDKRRFGDEALYVLIFRHAQDVRG